VGDLVGRGLLLFRGLRRQLVEIGGNGEIDVEQRRLDQGGNAFRQQFDIVVILGLSIWPKGILLRTGRLAAKWSAMTPLSMVSRISA
jgi:hypothetical protein